MIQPIAVALAFLNYVLLLAHYHTYRLMGLSSKVCSMYLTLPKRLQTLSPHNVLVSFSQPNQPPLRASLNSLTSGLDLPQDATSAAYET